MWELLAAVLGKVKGMQVGEAAHAEGELPAGSSAATSWVRWPPQPRDTQSGAQRRPAPAHVNCNVDHQLLHVQQSPGQDRCN